MDDWEDLGLSLTIGILIFGCCVVSLWKAYNHKPQTEALLRDTV